MAQSKQKPKNTAKRPPAPKGDMDRRWAILLFGVGLFLAALAVIPGESGWAWLRSNLLFGTFGISAWVLGAMVVWWAVLVSMDKPVFPAIIKGVVLLFVFSGAALVFGKADLTDLRFGEVLAALIENGRSGAFGGGLISLVFGASLLLLAGRTAARVLLVLLLLVAVMVVAGVTPGDIYRFFARTGGKLGEKWDERAAARAAAEEEYDEAYDEVYDDAPFAPAGQPVNGRRMPPREEAPLPAAPPRRMAVVDIPLEGGAQGPRRGSVDIDLGPDAPKSATTPYAAQPVDIGPGGTFGQKALEDEFGLGDFEPLVPFGAPARAAAAARQEEVGEGVLLFGEDDPYARLGGADTKLPPGTHLDVEYIEPEPDPAFDLFGQNAPGAAMPAPLPQEGPGQEGPFAGVAPVTAAGPGTPLPANGTAAAGPGGPFAENAPLQGGGDVPGPGSAVQLPEMAGAQPAAGEPATAQTGDNVEALIEKAAQVKDGTAPAQDTRANQPVVQPYHFPPASLFAAQPPEATSGVREEMRRTADLLVGTLASFGVETRILDVSRGPSVTRYEVQPQAGVKISRITNLADDIALNLAAAGVRIEAPIPGKPAVGIEVPNKVKTTVSIRGILESAAFADAPSPLAFALGKDIAGEVVVADLTRMPHLLIAGSTGSGKSVCINSIIMSFLYKSAPEDVRMILIDPKVVELAEYNGIPHLLIPVVTEARQAAKALGHAVAMMERRYHLFAEYNVRDISSYNKLAARRLDMEKIPHIAIIIDELADLMMAAGKDVENFICRIAQKARAAGMHLIVATQRPSVDVITGLIKSNIPSRIAFAVSSQVDSRTILDGAGAEKLLGMGDMLFMPLGANKPVRVQGTYVKDKEISAVLKYVKSNYSAQYDSDVLAEMEKVQLSGAAGHSEDFESADALQDEVFRSAVDIALDAGEISTSGLQRRLRLGYARAGRIVDQMEQMGIVSEPNGSKPRQVLINRQQWQEMVMNSSD
ncbi:DNA translocase FtsK [Ruminococcaceae bacterium OttesenSCG-928-O06]|nr:DNA translocase FtsK [Ruminococcaceae bacterium OttesenSCG-928-O06]